HILVCAQLVADGKDTNLMKHLARNADRTCRRDQVAFGHRIKIPGYISTLGDTGPSWLLRLSRGLNKTVSSAIDASLREIPDERGERTQVFLLPGVVCIEEGDIGRVRFPDATIPCGCLAAVCLLHDFYAVIGNLGRQGCTVVG